MLFVNILVANLECAGLPPVRFEAAAAIQLGGCGLGRRDRNENLFQGREGAGFGQQICQERLSGAFAALRLGHVDAIDAAFVVFLDARFADEGRGTD